MWKSFGCGFCTSEVITEQHTSSNCQWVQVHHMWVVVAKNQSPVIICIHITSLAAWFGRIKLFFARLFVVAGLEIFQTTIEVHFKWTQTQARPLFVQRLIFAVSLLHCIEFMLLLLYSPVSALGFLRRTAMSLFALSEWVSLLNFLRLWWFNMWSVWRWWCIKLCRDRRGMVDRDNV